MTSLHSKAGKTWTAPSACAKIDAIQCGQTSRLADALSAMRGGCGSGGVVPTLLPTLAATGWGGKSGSSPSSAKQSINVHAGPNGASRKRETFLPPEILVDISDLSMR